MTNTCYSEAIRGGAQRCIKKFLSIFRRKDIGLGLGDVRDPPLGRALAPPCYEWRLRCYVCSYEQVGEWQGLKERPHALRKVAQLYEAAKENAPRSTSSQTRRLGGLERLPERYATPTSQSEDGCAICQFVMPR